MDKEQIMIDGVDVSKCKDYGYRGEAGYWCHYYDEPCIDYPNCDFKQLQRKTAECEELKDKMADVIYRATGGRLSYSSYTLDAIEQAFNDQLEILSDQKVEEEIKELNQKLYSVQNEVHFKTEYIQEQREEIKQLEQKNEELKEDYKELEQRHNEAFQEFEQLKQECKDLKSERLISMQEKEIDRYRKALDEIEEFCLTYSDNHDAYETVYKYILDIINKAKGAGICQ